MAAVIADADCLTEAQLDWLRSGGGRATPRQDDAPRFAVSHGPGFLAKVIAAVFLARAVALLELLMRLVGFARKKTPHVVEAELNVAERLSEVTDGTFAELGEDGATLVDLDLAAGARASSDRALERAAAAVGDGGAAGHDLVLEFRAEGDVSVADVAAAQWNDSKFYAAFLADDRPAVGDWVADRRTVLTRHPLGFRPPAWTGISGGIPTRKTQRKFASDRRVVVVEESRFQDIPFADAIVVHTLWVVDEDDGGATRVRIFFKNHFGDAVPRWLRAVVAGKTRDELRAVYARYGRATAASLREAAAAVVAAVDETAPSPPLDHLARGRFYPLSAATAS